MDRGRWIVTRGLWPVLGLLTACGGNFEPTGVATTAGVDAMARTGALPLARPAAHDPKPTGFTSVAPVRGTASRGVLLDGVPGAQALESLRGYVEDTASLKIQSEPVDRLRMNAVIARTATVGQVNTALTALGARIVSMQPGNSEVTLDVASFGRQRSKTAVATQLLATRAFEAADGVQPAAQRAPVTPTALGFDPYAPAPPDDHQSPS